MLVNLGSILEKTLFQYQQFACEISSSRVTNPIGLPGVEGVFRTWD